MIDCSNYFKAPSTLLKNVRHNLTEPLMKAFDEEINFSHKPAFLFLKQQIMFMFTFFLNAGTTSMLACL